MESVTSPQDRRSPASPALDEVLATAHVVAIPTRTRFRGITVREAVVFEGPNGASEFSPFPEYGDAEAAAWLAAALDFGWGETPTLLRDRIEVNATVPAVPAERVPEVLARFPGCTTAKVKVAERGHSLAEDTARVRAVREALGDDALLRVDANGGWSVTAAAAALSALAPFGLDYAEQPCATVPELVELRRRLSKHRATDQKVGGSALTVTTTRQAARGDESTDADHTSPDSNPEPSDGQSPLIRIAADESVRKASDPLAVARAGAADLLVVKAQPLGGIRRAVDLVAEAGLPVVVSSALDTSAGISMGLYLAAALPEHMLVGACGLGTAALLDGDVTEDPLVPVAGHIAVRRPQLSSALLADHRAAPARERWWLSRVERCYSRLVSRTAR